MNKKLMEKAGFEKEVSLYQRGICPICKTYVDKTRFKDGLSVKEFTISGLCQRCQDEVFGED